MPMNLCEVMRAAGDLDGAAVEMERATKLFPDFEGLWYNWGVVEEERGRLVEAEAALVQYMKVVDRQRITGEVDPNGTNPTKTRARSLLGDIYHRLGMVEKSQRLFESATSGAEGYGESREPTNWLHLGIAHQLEGRLLEAKAAYETAIRMDPDEQSVVSRANLAAVQHELGDLMGAINAYYDILHRFPEREPSMVRNNLGAALLIGGRHDEGVAMLEGVVAMKPEMREAHINLGSFFDEEG